LLRDCQEIANFMPDDFSYDSIEPIVMFYKKKYRLSDGVESI
jgi:hypothetical protein